MSPPAPPDPTRAELRSLVLNYLCHYCFVDTANAFARSEPWQEARIEEDGDDAAAVTLTEDQLRKVETRRDVREHILSGEIPAARALINSEFPNVLDDSFSLIPTSTPVPPPPSAAPSTPQIPTYPSSLSPTNISMNLSIQNWIEIIRTIPLPYPPVDSSLPPAPPPAPVPQDQTALIETGRHLYATARTLPPPDNETYREELISIAGLMAYTEPEKSPDSVRFHLDWTRREGVGSQVNSAILHSLGFPAYPPLASLIRQLTFVYQMLHELGVRAPPEGYPTGVEVLDPYEGEEQDWGVEAIPEFKLDPYLYKERIRGRQRTEEDEDEDMDMEAEGEYDEEVEEEQ